MVFFVESGMFHETSASAGVLRVGSFEYSADELEEIGNELQICIVLSEGSDMMSWISKDSANFRLWLNSEGGQSALRAYLSEYPLAKILQRGKYIIEQYEHPENLKSLIADDVALSVFVADFREAYPRAVEDIRVSDGQTLH